MVRFSTCGIGYSTEKFTARGYRRPSQYERDPRQAIEIYASSPGQMDTPPPRGRVRQHLMMGRIGAEKPNPSTYVVGTSPVASYVRQNPRQGEENVGAWKGCAKLRPQVIRRGGKRGVQLYYIDNCMGCP